MANWYEQEAEAAKSAASLIGKTVTAQPFNPNCRTFNQPDPYEAVVEAVSEDGRRLKVRPLNGAHRRWIGIMSIRQAA